MKRVILVSLKYFDKHGNMTFSDMKDYNPFSEKVKQMYEAIESQEEEAQGFGFLGVPTFKDEWFCTESLISLFYFQR